MRALCPHSRHNRLNCQTLNKLLEFIRSTYVVLLFVVIEALALHYYANSSPYTQARLLAQSTRVAGGVHGLFSGVKHFFGLGRENRQLMARVAELESELAAWRRTASPLPADSTQVVIGERQFRMTPATVVSNSINKLRNFIVFDRGRRDGVERDMAVLSSTGAMVGYVVEVSERYAVAISILNTAFRASGKVRGDTYSGSILWEGTDARTVTMTELAKYARIEPGDTVVSTGFSQYFPADIPIGTVVRADLNEAQTAYTVQVRLMAHMSGLGPVILVKNNDLPEVRSLLESERVEELKNRP